MAKNKLNKLAKVNPRFMFFGVLALVGKLRLLRKFKRNLNLRFRLYIREGEALHAIGFGESVDWVLALFSAIYRGG